MDQGQASIDIDVMSTELAKPLSVWDNLVWHVALSNGPTASDPGTKKAVVKFLQQWLYANGNISLVVSPRTGWNAIEMPFLPIISANCQIVSARHGVCNPGGQDCKICSFDSNIRGSEHVWSNSFVGEDMSRFMQCDTAVARRVEMMLKTGRKNHPRNFRGGAHHVIPKVMTLKWEDHMHRMIMNMESHKNTLFADTFPSERFLANLLPSLQWKLEADWLQDLHFGMSLEWNCW